MDFPVAEQAEDYFPQVEEADCFAVADPEVFVQKEAVRQLAETAVAVSVGLLTVAGELDYFDSRFACRNYRSNSIRFRMAEVLRNRQLADLLR